MNFINHHDLYKMSLGSFIIRFNNDLSLITMKTGNEMIDTLSIKLTDLLRQELTSLISSKFKITNINLLENIIREITDPNYI